jgi:hypothetical protein
MEQDAGEPWDTERRLSGKRTGFTGFGRMNRITAANDKAFIL